MTGIELLNDNKELLDKCRSMLNEQELLDTERLGDFMACTINSSNPRICLTLECSNHAISTLALFIAMSAVMEKDQHRLGKSTENAGYHELSDDLIRVRIYGRYFSLSADKRVRIHV